MAAYRHGKKIGETVSTICKAILAVAKTCYTYTYPFIYAISSQMIG